MKKLIYDRPVNRSLLKEAITLSAEVFSFMDQRYHGVSRDKIMLSLNNKTFPVKLSFSISKDGSQKIYQIRYSQNSELAHYFQQIFKSSKSDIENQSKGAHKGQRIKTRFLEYFKLYATDDWDVFEGEIIVSNDNLTATANAPDDKNSWLPENYTPEISVEKLHAQQSQEGNGENEVAQMTENPMIAEFKNLLLSSKQIILTGAPGTGKTYLAKQIAQALTGKEENVEFCQFHPSFDYTDFVEGLRPIDRGNGNIGFERRDGIFKAFCKRALKNYLDSQKSKQVIEAERSAQDKIEAFLNNMIEKQEESQNWLQTTTGNKFKILNFDEQHIFIEIPGNEKVSELSLSYQEILKIISENIQLEKAGDIKRIFKRTHNRQSDSYVYIICSEIRKQKNITSTVAQNQVKLENFVFIIDEINRGDISKIFGELFYAVDPGYRGKDGKVTTQYDNLIDETDLYYGGFYIPKNVYIIGTMNDIDRSVESMDFAIRRRFTWKEIEAKDAVGMWDYTIPEYKDEAFEKMTRLNEVIEQTESLSKAFHIGPAYFLKLKDYKGDSQKLWDLHIMPLLKEYLRGTFDTETALENLNAAYFNSADSSIGE